MIIEYNSSCQLFFRMLYPSTEEYKDSKFLGQTYSLPMMLHIVLRQTNFFQDHFIQRVRLD